MKPVEKGTACGSFFARQSEPTGRDYILSPSNLNNQIVPRGLEPVLREHRGGFRMG